MFFSLWIDKNISLQQFCPWRSRNGGTARLHRVPGLQRAVILLVNGIGAACFKERLTRREIIATAMIAAALVMLNI
ncbi:MAG TPA: hypothetical protein IAD16_03750 [Candidatus Fimisoma avicola]|uniref:Uncharacterized protein n=1 Tax=Candidatus Fimisoma avicola TaxID=2840826 RepID=A0A9D1L850_9FIRM|nr:hypothetical protein [Candidatus Fimisoma avicola]